MYKRLGRQSRTFCGQSKQSTSTWPPVLFENKQTLQHWIFWWTQILRNTATTTHTSQWRYVHHLLKSLSWCFNLDEKTSEPHPFKRSVKTFGGLYLETMPHEKLAWWIVVVRSLWCIVDYDTLWWWEQCVYWLVGGCYGTSSSFGRLCLWLWPIPGPLPSILDPSSRAKQHLNFPSKIMNTKTKRSANKAKIDVTISLTTDKTKYKAQVSEENSDTNTVYLGKALHHYIFTRSFKTLLQLKVSSS